MAKILSKNERGLQRRLIPVNIFVCILALISALSLALTPIVKIDFGKILRSGTTVEMVDNYVDDVLGGGTQTVAGEINFAPVVSVIVNKVLGSAEGAATVTTLGTFKVAKAKKSEDKAELVKQELFFGEGKLVSSLIKSISDAIAGLFDSEECIQAIEDFIVNALTTQLIANLPDDAKDNISAEDKAELVSLFRNIDGKDREGAKEVANEFAQAAVSALGESYVTEENVNTISDYIMELYDDASAASGASTVTVESVICVAVSKNINLSEFNFTEIIENALGGSDDDGGSDDGEQNGEDNGEDNQEGSINLTSITLTASGGESSNPVYTTYKDLMGAMGLGADDIGPLSEKIEKALRSSIDGMTGSVSNYLGYYGYIFYAMLSFIVLWIILFLFSLIHIFKKNKRFLMWYVKLFCFLPCLIFFVSPLLAPKILGAVAPDFLAGTAGAMLSTVLSGITSMTWISGVCYVILWLVSIFWAFPIKHKIRKERKRCKKAIKNGTYVDDTVPAASPDNAGSQPDNSYGSYGDYQPDGGYGGYQPDSSYGSSYGSSYDSYGSSYGSSYGDSYGSGYGSSYGGYGSGYDSYGGYESDHGFDADDGFDDLFNSDAYSSGYSSYGFDDDDDF